MGVFDTEDLARYTFGSSKLRLWTLLTKLQCPFANLHCAGNDAHFALRALLLLTVEGYRGFEVDDVARDRLEMLQAIGQANNSLILPYRESIYPAILRSSKTKA